MFDDTMGFVVSMVRTAAFTGRLGVSYLAPAPVDEELEFRCRLRDRDGRKLVIEGEARHDDDVVATDEGLIVAIDPARLCPRPSPGGVDAPGGPWAVPALTKSRAISRR